MKESLAKKESGAERQKISAKTIKKMASKKNQRKCGSYGSA